MSKVVKGIGKAVKGLAKGIVKVFKKVVKSKIGRAIIIAAAIYFGGAALGMWNSVSPAVNGAWTAAGSQAAQTAAATTAGQVAATGSTTALSGGAAAAMPTGIEVLTVTGTPTAGLTAGQIAGGAAGVAASGATANAAAPGVTTRPTQLPAGTQSPPIGEIPGAPAPVTTNEGILERLMNGGRRVFVNPDGSMNTFGTAMAVNTAASMLSPDQMDLQEQQQKYEEKDRARREGNWHVRGIVQDAMAERAARAAGEPSFTHGFLNSAMTPRTP